MPVTKFRQCERITVCQFVVKSRSSLHVTVFVKSDDVSRGKHFAIRI